LLTSSQLATFEIGQLVHANHRGGRYHATVTTEGWLKLPNVSEPLSPSTGAKRITGRATNGWAFWLVPQAGGAPESLRRLRARLLAERG
jgi:hypothetical protein